MKNISKRPGPLSDVLEGVPSMELIGLYHNAGFEAVADGVMVFCERREDLQQPGIAFGPGGSDAEPAKVSTDISLVALKPF